MDLQNPEILVLTTGALLILSILSSKLSEWLGVPALLVFLGVGMLAGSDGIGRIQFDNPVVANLIGTYALAFILFSGGMDTRWNEVRHVLGRGIVLATLGVAITAGLVGLFAWLVLGFRPLDGLLLGSIISSTDAAAVFAVLRSRGVSLKGDLKPLLEFESGSNDPMAVFLTTAMLTLIMTPESGVGGMVLALVRQMTLGALAGYAAGRLGRWSFDRVRLEYEGLYPVMSMGLVLLAFGATSAIGGNGFLAVYVCGIVLGNSGFVHKRYLEKFHDGLGWLMQILMFLALGLLVFPSRLGGVAVEALLVAGFLMFVARPAAVYLGMLGSRFDWAQRTLLAWTGLRGAVPVVLATFPLLAGHPASDRIFNIVFFVVLTSVLLQGKSLMPVARSLRVDKPLDQRPRNPLEFDRSDAMKGGTREIEIDVQSPVLGRAIAELGFPSDALVLLIRRGDGFVIPRGSSRVECGDVLMVIAPDETLDAIELRLTGHLVERSV